MRPTRHETMLKMATVIAQRSTCSRRQVGCVLCDSYGRVLSVGHNGVPRGAPHCTDFPCAGAGKKSGTGLDLCQAVHAEQNALMFCSDVMKIDTVYLTTSPCIHCVKMLLNTSAIKIVFLEEYPHDEAAALWVADGRHWFKVAA